MDIIGTFKGTRITFDYTNHRGETAARNTECNGSPPIWMATEWHAEPQWILPMFDLDRKAWRDFALKDMRNVRFYKD